MQRPRQNVHVAGPRGQSIEVKFFDDGSVRFRLNDAGPMVIRYAFLPGNGQNVIIEVSPGPNSPWPKGGDRL
jgi:hypothetical protein